MSKGHAANDPLLTQVGIPVFALQILTHVIPYVTDYVCLGSRRVPTRTRGFCNHSEKEVQTQEKLHHEI